MRPLPPLDPQINILSGRIVDAAYDVHVHIGPGMLESVYEACLGEALRKRQIQFERQKTLPLVYEGLTIPEAYRVDLIVEDSIIIEIKSVEHLLPVHEAQLLTYLRLAKIRLGLLIKFNVAQIRVGIRRMIL